jgi:hypothetical protein
MKVLVIYPEIPDAQRLFVFNATEEELGILEDANGAYVNMDLTKKQEKATDWITAAVANPKYAHEWSPEHLRPVVGRWIPYEINALRLPEVTGIDKVFITGFYL